MKKQSTGSIGLSPQKNNRWLITALRCKIGSGSDIHSMCMVNTYRSFGIHKRAVAEAALFYISSQEDSLNSFQTGISGFFLKSLLNFNPFLIQIVYYFTSLKILLYPQYLL